MSFGGLYARRKRKVSNAKLINHGLMGGNIQLVNCCKYLDALAHIYNDIVGGGAGSGDKTRDLPFLL